MISDLDMFTRLVVAAILSGIIGFERERFGRAAGLRTHILVGTGSALIMLTSMYMFDIYKGVAQVDPSRIAAQVVAGIGFLGAGTILRSQTSVRGLTTAASLWAVAAIGLAVGCGMFHGAEIATALVLVVLFVFSKLEWSLLKKDCFRTIVISTKGSAEELGKIREVLSKYGVEIKDFGIEKQEGKPSVLVRMHLKVLTNIAYDKIIFDITKLDGVDKANWE
ncbi:MAG: methyltransferase [Candidatus Omnitrophica bacterium CG07_land_8_20_14_0_80_42_15]|uniref:Methyltransferase n=1 Tax=Candidatus Aquitaenariimonas noxiae TaxID=1974741 RepID=A0A2J0KU68_9BACT|nr:MAG: methyltransferase [Candidatus Omnitrophica bacterium CG07_land_8_20_14_0_80_42_15]